MVNAGDFEDGVNFKLCPRIPGDADIRHLYVPQRLTGPCNRKAGAERYLCVNCRLVRNKYQNPGRCSYDGLCEDGQEKIESIIGLRGNGRLDILQGSLVIPYNRRFRIADRQKSRREDNYRSVHPLRVGRPSVAV